MIAVADGEPCAAGLVIARRHRFVGDEQIVQPAWAGHAEFERGFKQRHAGIEQLARMIEGDGLQKSLGRQAGPAGEQLLQPGRCLADLLGQHFQRRLVAIVEADLFDGTTDDFVVSTFRRDVFLKDCCRFERHLGVHGSISLSANIVLRGADHHPKLAFPRHVPR
ncbi:hypothetical protein X772_06775 [Mesorhizobium sp. LSJC280B00]|nr:hypothetical protein X772_06775 [Mesorhizobium sp. LSJC280B00]